MSANALRDRTRDLLLTAQKLESQIAVTETTYLRGVLHPLTRHDIYKGRPSWNQLVVFWDLSALDSIEVRTRLPAVALPARDGPSILTAWRYELVSAVVGMDRRAANLLRDRLASLIRNNEPGPDQRLACAMWLAELPAANDEVAKQAVGILTDWLAKEQDSFLRPEVATSLGRLANGLSSEVAATLVRPVVRAIADRPPDGTNTYTFIKHIETVGPLAPWLEQDDKAS